MASEHQTCFPADYARLTTLYVSAANWKTNQHRRARLTNFVSKNIREEFLEYSPRSYRWAELERWLTHCLGYDSRKHDIMFAPFGLEDDNAKQLSSAYEWEDLLSDITKHCVVVAWYTEVFLLIMPRDDPYEFRRPVDTEAPEFRNPWPGINITRTEEKTSDGSVSPRTITPSQTIKEDHSGSHDNQKSGDSDPAKTPSLAASAELSDKGGAGSEKPSLTQTAESPSFEIEGIKLQGAPRDTRRAFDFQNPWVETRLAPYPAGGRRPGAVAASPPTPGPPIMADIVDIAADDYAIADEEDDDYGAFDLSVIDTYVGSYNTGERNPSDWHTCLRFFNIDIADYQRRESLPTRNGPERKRVPIKKLPGMAVGLELADRLPNGPNIIVAPARSCAAMMRDAKTKLDLKHFKMRAAYEGANKDDQLSIVDIGLLRAKAPAKKAGVDEPKGYPYEQILGLDQYIITVSPESIPKLSNGPGAGAHMPGVVLMDEFHEYASSKDGRTSVWLHGLKRSALDSQSPTPLMYFVSGTPFGETPADIRPAIALFEKEAWSDEAHPLHDVTLGRFDDLTNTFDRLASLQANGEAIPFEDILEYRRRLDRIFKHTMVRRLGTGKFQNRNLTSIGPLKTTSASLPSRRPRPRAKESDILFAAMPAKTCYSSCGLRPPFPGIASSPASADFTFTVPEILSVLSGAEGKIAQTPYYRHIPTWAANSPKLETINKTVTTMLDDKSRIEGESAHAKKYCIFCPLEAEALLLYGYLLLRKAKEKRLKPVWIHSGMTQAERQQTIDSFLEPGNAPPNVLVAPMDLAGTGLNLQKAKYSTVTSPAWMKRDNQQAYYRIHRVGQKQNTTQQLLTCRWNPAERVILAKYEGRVVEGDDVWEVSNRFCGLAKGGLVDRHQEADGDTQ
ncbi:hypothetical protein N656DRAFT_768495 [Canariomyces notabilis]|uniref:Helicase C-terminal domain-containing protein n=1 Tax=Canariomyces notabilis TaxID=2074819 RepID=A0AAN6YRQ3_9PEZI|nr:hypothetical protein N656DRAFT_768495 [Canariomyces arenarius]